MQHCLYIFGGNVGGKYTDTLERLEMNVPNARWEILNLAINEAAESYCAALLQVAEDQIIIFRGCGTSDVYAFDLKLNSIRKHGSIVAKTDRFREVSYRIGDVLYFVGLYGFMHTYSVKDGKYSAIN